MENQEKQPIENKEPLEKLQYPQLHFVVKDDEANRPFLDNMNRIREELKTSWKSAEPQIMATFEQVTGGTWDTHATENGIPVFLTSTERSRAVPSAFIQLSCREIGGKWAEENGLMGTIRTTQSIEGSLVHELGHNFMRRNDKDFLLEKFGDRFDPSSVKIDKSRFFNEVYAEVISKAVWDAWYPQDVVSSWLDRRQYGYEGVYAFLDTLSDEERKMILERTHPERMSGAASEERPPAQKIDMIREKVQTIFRRR